MGDDSPWHAHIYYDTAGRDAAAALRDRFGAEPAILFVGRMMDDPVGPHPVPQYEVHFLAPALPQIVAMIEASGVHALVHPLTHDDLADHVELGRWIGGEALALDMSVLDPPGVNQGIPRFGKTDF
jgi:DOPA 4,5-dioxygenase